MNRPGKKSVHLLVASAATAALALASLSMATPAPAEAPRPPGPTYAQAGVTYVGYPLPGRVEYGSPRAAGKVEVTVSADGRSISRFTVTDAVYGPKWACAGQQYSYTLTGPIPIHDGDYLGFSTMSDPQTKPFEVDGSIDPGRMIGRFQYDDPSSECSTFGNVGWVASAPGGCLGSPERVQLLSQNDMLTKKMAKLKKKMKKAKKAGKRHLVWKLQRKYRKARAARVPIRSRLSVICS